VPPSLCLAFYLLIRSKPSCGQFSDTLVNIFPNSAFVRALQSHIGGKRL
jgi:hypothetical protein